MVLAQRRQGGAHPHLDVRGALEEDAMQLATSDADTGPGRPPESFQLDFQQETSRVIQDSLMGDLDSSSQSLVCETERPERANAVSGNVEARTARWPRGRTFDDLGIEALRSQRPAEGKTRDSTTDNQNP